MSSDDSKPWYKRAEVIVPIIVAIIGLMGIIVPPFIPQPPEPPSDPQFITLQGKVVDETKMPVAGVTVSIDSLSDITGDDGKYCLRDVPLGSGVKIIRVEKMEKEIYKNAIEIDEGKKIMDYDIPLTLATPTPTQAGTEEIYKNAIEIDEGKNIMVVDIPLTLATPTPTQAGTEDVVYDVAAWDTNYDGVADMGDTNYDGNADVWDTNYDGVPDAFDTDGDGYIDMWL